MNLGLMDSGKYVDESTDLNWYWVYIMQFKYAQ